MKPRKSLKDTPEFLWRIKSTNDGGDVSSRRLVSQIESLVCIPDPSHPPPTVEWIANLDNIVAMSPKRLKHLELSFYRDSLNSVNDRSMYFKGILDIPLMGFGAILFTLDGEHLSSFHMQCMFLYQSCMGQSHDASTAVAEKMDREDCEEYYQNVQAAQPHEIVEIRLWGEQVERFQSHSADEFDLFDFCLGDESSSGHCLRGEPEYQSRRCEFLHLVTTA